MHRRPDAALAQIHLERDLLLTRLLVWVINAREALDLALPGLLIDTSPVRLLAVLQGRRDVDEEEATILADEVPSLGTGRSERRDRGSDDGGAGLCELGRDEADAADVLVAVFLREAELRGELGAHVLAQEERDGAPALLVERHVQGARDGVLAAVGVARQEDGEALLVAGWVGLAQDADDFGVGEPRGDVTAGAETAAEFWEESVKWMHVEGTT